VALETRSQISRRWVGPVPDRPGPVAGDTPWAVLEGLFEVKVVGGRSVKALSRCRVENLEEIEIPRGTRCRDGSNPLVLVIVLVVGSKALKPRVTWLAPNCSHGSAGLVKETAGGHSWLGKPGTARRRGQLPEGKTLDAAVGRNKPTMPVVE
jgi:hypothetical protein